MLAYVFWHRRRPEIASAAYAESLVEFHRVLSRHKPPGFRHSVTFWTEDAPWLPPGGGAYEDWYLTDGSAALDPLNEAAISGACAAPHDAVARAAAGGAGGLYRLRLGDSQLAGSPFAFWFGKPAGLSYADLFARLSTLGAGGAGLWMRQMVLGPAPEFCIAAPSIAAIPAGIEGVLLERERAWPEK